MKNRQIIICSIILIVIIILLNICFHFYNRDYKNTNAMLLKTNTMVSDVNSFDVFIQNSASFEDFDAISARIKNIDKKFNYFINDLNQFIEQNSINDLKHSFYEKIKNIEQFKAKKTKINLGMIKLNNAFLDMTDFSKDRFKILHSLFLNISYNKNIKVKDAYDFLKQNPPVDELEARYVDIVKNIIVDINDDLWLTKNYKNEFIARINNIHLNIDNKANFIKNIVSTITLLIFISSFMLGIFVIFILFNYFKNLKNFKVFNHIINKTFNSIIITNNDFRCIFANDNFLKYKNTSVGNILQKDIFKILNFKYEKDMLSLFNGLKHNQEVELENIVLLHNQSESYVHILAFIINLQNFKPEYAFLIFDKTKEQKIENKLNLTEVELEKIAFKDPITSAWNRSKLIKILPNSIDSVVISIFMENFANLRFFYSKTLLDKTMLEIFKSLELIIKTNSIDAEIFVINTDEFALLYNGGNILKDLEIIKRHFDGNPIKIFLNNNYQNVTQINLNFGVSLRFDTQINRLDQTSIARINGSLKKERISFYNRENEVEKTFYKNQKIINTLQNALLNNRIFFEYQGIFDISGNNPELFYYEILMRILDDNSNVIYPNSFMDIAKQSYLNSFLTISLFKHTFFIIEKFPHKKFSINISTGDIINPYTRDMFLSFLKKCSYPQHLSVEILECEDIENYNVFVSFIEDIKNYGCKISLDDFGSGYSNYYRILSLNIDCIKIDGSIIKKIDSDKISKELVETIVEFAKKQDYYIVAEHVSTPEILKIIKDMGIKYAQGFFLEKPKAISYI